MTRARRAVRPAGRHAAGRAARGRHARPSRVPHRALSLAVVPAVLASGTAAYAFWSATATGNATVPTATAVALTVTAGAAPDAFFPGRTVSLPITVANPNGYGVTLTRLTAVTATSSDPTNCPSEAAGAVEPDPNCHVCNGRPSV